jgi:hypothetical protein
MMAVFLIIFAKGSGGKKFYTNACAGIPRHSDRDRIINHSAARFYQQQSRRCTSGGMPLLELLRTVRTTTSDDSVFAALHRLALSCDALPAHCRCLRQAPGRVRALTRYDFVDALWWPRSTTASAANRPALHGTANGNTTRILSASVIRLEII